MAHISANGANGHHLFNFHVNETSTDTANNTSTVAWSFNIEAIQNGWDFYTIGSTIKIVINGTTVYEQYAQRSFGGSGYTIWAEGTTTIPHNSDGTKSISFSFSYSQSSTANYTPGNASASGSMNLTTIPRYVNITSFTVSKRDETSVQYAYDSDATCDWAWYSKDNGSSWSNLPNSGVVSGLSANTTYKFKLRLRRKDSQLTTDSGAVSQTTYNYPHCTEAPNFTIGDTLSIKLYNPLKRSITVTMEGADGSSQTTGSYTGTSVSGFRNSDWAPFWYKSIPNSQSGTYKVKVNYGSIVKTTTGGTYTINSSVCTPTVGSISYEDTNTTVTGITGNNQHIVQNQSNLKVTYTKATAKNSASISNYTFVLNGVTKTNTSAGGTVDFGKVNSASNLTLTMTVTDSRGLTAKATKTITMLAHKAPSAIVTLKRLNNYEDETYLTVDGSISSVNSKNTMTIKYRYKVSGGSYNSYATINDNVKNTLSLDKNNAYIFNVVVTDAFGTTYNKEHVLEKGVFPLFIDTVLNSVGINGFPSKEKALEVFGELVLKKKLLMKNGFDGNSGIYNENNMPVVIDHTNNNISVNATGKLLFLGYTNTTGLNLLNGKVTVDADGKITLPQNKYFGTGGAIDANNSDIVKANCIFFADECSGVEGINFPKQNGDLTTTGGFENLRGYRGNLYYNNRIMQLGRSVIRTGRVDRPTLKLSTAWTKYVIPFNTTYVRLNYHSQLSRSGNTIVIGANCSRVMVSCQVCLYQGTVVSGEVDVTIHKNGNQVAWCTQAHHLSGMVITFSIPPTLIDVVEGDVLDVRIATGQSLNFTLLGDEGTGSSFTVEAIT